MKKNCIAFPFPMHLSLGYNYMLSITQFLLALSQHTDVYLFSLDSKQELIKFLSNVLRTKLPENLYATQISNKIIGFRSNKIFFTPKVISKIRKLEKKYLNVVVYSRDMKQLNRVGKYLDNIPIAFECHQILSSNLCRTGNFKNAIDMRKLENTLFSRADYIFSITPTLSLDIKRTFALSSETMLQVLPVGVGEHFFNINNTNNSFEFDLLYSGGFSSWKGIETLIDALEILHISRSNFKVLMVGVDDHQYKRFHKMIIDKGLENNVHLKEKIPQSDLLQFISRSKTAVVVVSNQEDGLLYTSPLKLYEYLASGIRVIVSRTPAIQSAIPEDLVIWALPDDPSSYADKINEALTTHDTKRHDRIKFASEFTWDKRAKKVSSMLFGAPCHQKID